MNYIKVKWIHSFSYEPIWLYSELDSENWETRKVEVFADGKMSFADDKSTSGDTGLSIEPLPPLEIIAADPEFEPATISAEEFESVWRKATAR